ncbi:ATP-dependent DNA helicase RecQ2 [Capnocytophaga canis]|uniref:RecQ family ATP-dependent DNA helicase n=1 Tax=Capnocytophaga canis TaxID=1848903 RepID=UPI001AC9452E|nr:ATP-dependent DNA helicase RecQ [Capnocytophaga canis]GIM60392.1 ATP-dependent DNA helicase RecQ2 [Capnocytophaga canis]
MNATILHILKKHWGYDSFRHPQDAIIESVLRGKDVLALMPTGGGKSVTFQVPALVNEGICLVVSPLIALISDQVENLKSRGVKAISLAGTMSQDDLERLLNNAVLGDYKFLYLSPERLQQETVRYFIKLMKINLIAIDEAHCVSHWGKDFRPAYLECKWLKENFPEVPILALTASATPKVQHDILQQLSIPNAEIIATSLKRPNIAYITYKTDNKWLQLERILKKNTGTSIVYVRSRNGTVRMAEYLQDIGISATFFHGGLSSEEKNKKLSMWLIDDVQVMVATNAFGMGIDKPDVRTVIHWEIPPTLEDYFQEAGRAGRDGQKSFAILLFNDSDLENTKRQFIANLVTTEDLKLLYAKLNAYFLIAYGEGMGETRSFQLVDFCKKYNLQTQKAYNGLQLLDRLSVISLSQNFQKKATILFVGSNHEIIQYLQHKQSFKDIVFYLLRNYPGIHTQSVSVRIEKIADKIRVESEKIRQQLTVLQEDGIITYQDDTSDIEITFNMPREDNRTIAFVAKNIKEYNQTKIDLQKSVFDYIVNFNECKSVQLLRYFGEKETAACGICSVCKAKNKQKAVDYKEVEQQLVRILQQGNKNLNDLLLLLPFEEKEIQKVLFSMLDMNKIRFNDYNQYALRQ